MRVVDVNAPDTPEWVDRRYYADGQVEWRLRILPKKIESVVVYASLTSPDIIVSLVVLLDLLKRHDIPYVLRLGYTLGGRSDRVFNGVTGVPAIAIGQMLSHVLPAATWVLDPHSDVTSFAWRATPITHAGLYAGLPEKTTLILPDKGAVERTGQVLKHTPIPVVQCTKTRDLDGAPEVILPGVLLDGRDCVIVDDLCDGGRTFTQLARACKRQGARSVELRVTYGLFSRGFEALWESGVDKIVTTTGAAPSMGSLRVIYGDPRVRVLDWREAWSDFTPPR